MDNKLKRLERNKFKGWEHNKINWTILLVSHSKMLHKIRNLQIKIHDVCNSMVTYVTFLKFWAHSSCIILRSYSGQKQTFIHLLYVHYMYIREKVMFFACRKNVTLSNQQFSLM